MIKVSIIIIFEVCILIKSKDDVKQKIEKMQAELNLRITSYGEKDLNLDSEIYELSTEIDRLIIAYLKS